MTKLLRWIWATFVVYNSDFSDWIGFGFDTIFNDCLDWANLEEVRHVCAAESSALRPFGRTQGPLSCWCRARTGFTTSRTLRASLRGAETELVHLVVADPDFPELSSDDFADLDSAGVFKEPGFDCHFPAYQRAFRHAHLV